LLGVTFHEVDIRPLAFAIMKAMGHKPFGIDLERLTLRHEGDTELEVFVGLLSQLPKGSKDLTFENVQAHVRTLLITRFGFSFGTGDMSELIIGWCTWLADQLGGHYNSQATMPKTLVRFQVKHQAEHDFDGEIRATLLDIHDTEVTPELLPIGPNGEVSQKTDDTNGPEEVRDFYMRYFRRYGDPPEKILYLIEHANREGGYTRVYEEAELIAWWQRFVTRVIGQRFKNATRVDGVQVGSDSLSPHGNWVVPSDASSTVWQLPEDFELASFFAEVERQVETSACTAGDIKPDTAE
jgi:NAD+ synthase (glutamine-hydrolysing)